MTKNKIFLVFVVVLMLCFCMNISAFCCSGALDDNGGHFCQKDGLAATYHYHQGCNAGYELTFSNPVKWNARGGIKKPLNINDDSLGCWKYYKDCKFDGNSEEIKNEQPSETIKEDPVKETTSTTVTSSTEETQKTMPQTGENSNTFFISIGLFIVCLGVVYYKFKIKNASTH